LAKEPKLIQSLGATNAKHTQKRVYSEAGTIYHLAYRGLEPFFLPAFVESNTMPSFSQQNSRASFQEALGKIFTSFPSSRELLSCYSTIHPT
jgi:hypothetical protein